MKRIVARLILASDVSPAIWDRATLFNCVSEGNNTGYGSILVENDEEIL